MSLFSIQVLFIYHNMQDDESIFNKKVFIYKNVLADESIFNPSTVYPFITQS